MILQKKFGQHANPRSRNLWKWFRHLRSKYVKISSRGSEKILQFNFRNTTLDPQTESSEVTLPRHAPTYKEIATANQEDSICCLRLITGSAVSNHSQKMFIFENRSPCYHSQMLGKREIPNCWKASVSVLIYKNREANDPSNFRPISLQPSWYQILVTIMKNTIYSNIRTKTTTSTKSFRKVTGQNAMESLNTMNNSPTSSGRQRRTIKD